MHFYFQSDCAYYLQFHKPSHVIPNSAGGYGLPYQLELRPGAGLGGGGGARERRGRVFAKVPIKAFTRFGPLKGRLTLEEKIDFDEDRAMVYIVQTEQGNR